jgi:hypothetical protein
VLRILPALIEITLTLYCLIDAIQTPEGEMRNLPKMIWILLILFIPVIGPIVWLIAGRPQRGSARQVPWPSTQTAGFPEYERPRPLGPDDDPEFLREMKRGNDEQEQLLSRWEEDLRRREQQLKPPSEEPREDGPEGAPTPGA